MGAVAIILQPVALRAADRAAPDVERDSLMVDVEMMYAQWAQRPPTEENVIRSLNIEIPQGFQLIELTAALWLMDLKYQPTPAVLERIDELARRAESPLTRVRAVITLVSRDPVRGRRYGQAIIADRGFQLESRIILAESLALKGELWVYPVLNEAFAQNTEYFDLLTRNLISAFRTHEGKAWNEAGDRVELGTFRAGLEARATARNEAK